MKRNRSVIRLAAAVIAAALQALPAWAYEPATHESLSEMAFYGSQLFTNPEIRSRWGLKPEVAEELRFNRRTAQDWIKKGAREEDEGVRALHHFFNPRNGRGFEGGSILGRPYRGHSSPDWAYANEGNVHSFTRARTSFLKALTAPGKEERELWFGDTFQALGQVVHHLQDMAQPQHTRNDPHCPAWVCFLMNIELDGRLSPGLYELYSDERNARGDLNPHYFAYPPVYPDLSDSVFATPRRFWATGGNSRDGVLGGDGIAEFSHRNFVSSGTNFRASGGVISNSPDFDLPDLGPLVPEPPTDICGADPSIRDSRPHLCFKKMQFVSTTVTDALSSAHDRLSSRISSYGLLDADLREIGATQIFTQNRIVFDDMHRFLIPRAVGYSTGFLNYFFRGDITMERDLADPGKYRLLNRGSEALHGTFGLYYEDALGNRIKVTEWTNTRIDPRSELGGLTFSIPPEPPPAPEWKEKLLLVFSGQMGAEVPEADVTPGAVTSAVVKFQPFVLFRGYREDDNEPADSMMGINFMIPDDYLALFRDQYHTAEVLLDGEPISRTHVTAGGCSYIYCDIVSGIHVIDNEYTRQWQLTTTRNNEFVFFDNFGTPIARGNGLEALDSLPDSIRCKNVTSNDIELLGYINGPPHVVEVRIGNPSRLAFAFKVETNAQNQAILSELKNARINAKRCGPEPKPAP